MRVITSVILLPIIIYCCSNFNSGPSSPNLKFTFSYPTNYVKDGKKIKVYSLQDTITIFSSGDYRIMRLPYQKVEFKSGKGIPSTEPYFVYIQDEQYGSYYNNIDDLGGSKLKVDSLLNVTKTKINGFEPLTDSIWKLTGKGKLSNGLIFEKYGAIHKINASIFDTIYYFFDKELNNVSYSFSPLLDSIKAMKLCKVRLIYNQNFSQKDDAMLPEREFTFSMSPTNEKMPKPIMEMLERFKKQKF